MTVPVRFRVVGVGRAGGALSLALQRAGWESVGDLGRGADLSNATADVDAVFVTTPDGAIAEVAAKMRPQPNTVVAHLSGSLGLDVLAPHTRRASVHPLVSLPSAAVGARRLSAGAWFGVAGDPLVQRVASDLGGQFFEVAEGDRGVYHAAAVVASNHVVALLGQVERLAAGIGVPAEAYLDLARASIENVADLGAAAALTGPVARGDWDTVRRHLAVLDASELSTYETLMAEAARLAGKTLPADLS